MDSSGRAYLLDSVTGEVFYIATPSLEEFAGLTHDVLTPAHIQELSDADLAEWDTMFLDWENLQATVDWCTNSRDVEFAGIANDALQHPKYTPVNLETTPFYLDSGASVHISHELLDFHELTCLPPRAVRGTLRFVPKRSMYGTQTKGDWEHVMENFGARRTTNYKRSATYRFSAAAYTDDSDAHTLQMTQMHTCAANIRSASSTTDILSDTSATSRHALQENIILQQGISQPLCDTLNRLSNTAVEVDNITFLGRPVIASTGSSSHGRLQLKFSFSQVDRTPANKHSLLDDSSEDGTPSKRGRT
ncbi:hypothetical protein DEU56DRAFT_759882 [Suillus clintonianus]|uniref:uncharacterized protein n=1 Tax=Suillus clintonianus TaxID=1904413 RepID=UPI001B88075E|nr:uncharacterized protein DEU56DRAFT_759882 [Suillus clintonianus]KAG2123851.1 hypothetical protein DEU56DRAFT_759882 [Suillus clintonianus]